MTQVADTAGTGILRALRERRSFAQVAPEEPPRELIRQVIEACTWAPNHHRTEPWRFVVLTGLAREEMGDFLAGIRRSQLEDPDGDEGRKVVEKERAKPLRAPVLIVVAAVPTGHPKAIEIEEIQAVAAGVENMLIAAEALGLHAMWRTGKPAYDDAVKRYLGLPSGSHIVAFVSLGYPVLPRVPRRRQDISHLITWRDGRES